MAESLTLSDADRDMLAGGAGPAAAWCLRMVIALAEVRGAGRLLSIDSAHIDGCLYHGQAGLDFAERLVELGGVVLNKTPQIPLQEGFGYYEYRNR